MELIAFQSDETPISKFHPSKSEPIISDEHHHPPQIRAGDYSHPTFQLTSTLLSQNPEYYTIWNHRRLLLRDVFARELASNPDSDPSSDADAAAASSQGLTPAQHQIALLIRVRVVEIDIRHALDDLVVAALKEQNA